MNDKKKYYIYLILAIVFYVWGLGALWYAHEVVMPEPTFFLVGVLPVAAGVIMMVMALQTYMNALSESEESEDTPTSTT